MKKCVIKFNITLKEYEEKLIQLCNLEIYIMLFLPISNIVFKKDFFFRKHNKKVGLFDQNKSVYLKCL